MSSFQLVIFILTRLVAFIFTYLVVYVSSLSLTSKSNPIKMAIANQPNPTQNTTIIDADGDIILVLGDSWTSTGRRFQVSSKLLSLASPTFKALLAKFTHSSDPSYVGFEVSLDAADEPSLEVLLSVLHFHDIDRYSTLTPSRLATVAHLSNKYECNKALKPFTTQWLRGFSADVALSVSSYGTLLQAAWLFDRDDFFKSLSVGAIKRLPFRFRRVWAAEDIALELPSNIKSLPSPFLPFITTDTSPDAIAINIGTGLKALRSAIEAVEVTLRADKTAHATPRKLCPLCGRNMPPNARNCRPCGNKFLYSALCSRDVRIAEYFYFLTKAQLWPTVEPFLDLSITEIVQRVHDAKTSAFELHTCDGGVECPLKVEFKDLVAKADRVVDTVKGVDFRTLNG